MGLRPAVLMSEEEGRTRRSWISHPCASQDSLIEMRDAQPLAMVVCDAVSNSEHTATAHLPCWHRYGAPVSRRSNRPHDRGLATYSWVPTARSSGQPSRRLPDPPGRFGEIRRQQDRQSITNRFTILGWDGADKVLDRCARSRHFRLDGHGVFPHGAPVIQSDGDLQHPLLSGLAQRGSPSSSVRFSSPQKLAPPFDVRLDVEGNAPRSPLPTEAFRLTSFDEHGGVTYGSLPSMCVEPARFRPRPNRARTQGFIERDSGVLQRTVPTQQPFTKQNLGFLREGVTGR